MFYTVRVQFVYNYINIGIDHNFEIKTSEEKLQYMYSIVQFEKIQKEVCEKSFDQIDMVLKTSRISLKEGDRHF